MFHTLGRSGNVALRKTCGRGDSVEAVFGEYSVPESVPIAMQVLRIH